MNVVTKKDFKDRAALAAKAAALMKKGMNAEAARSCRFYLSKWQDPEIYFMLGFLCHQANDAQAAIASYEKALELRPDYVDAYLNLGSVHLQRQDFVQALAQYDKAISYNAMLPQAHYNRGIALHELHQLEEALADYDTTIKLKPDFYLAHMKRSVLLYKLKRKTEARRTCEWLLSQGQNTSDARWVLGLISLSEGDFAMGWALFETRRGDEIEAYDRVLRKPYWLGREGIVGKTLFIKWEQGFGDTIQFCRYAKLVRETGANVIFSVQRPLRRLLESLDHEITLIGEDDVPGHYDFHCRLMSLPHAIGTAVATVPYPRRYLHVASEAVAAWASRLEGIEGIKIGLVWAGNFNADLLVVRRSDVHRSLTLEHYLPLLDVGGAAFFSLQKGPPASQLAAAPTGHRITDFTAEFSDFADTGAFIENLDLVITVDTAVAHLAAALGKPVWILVSFVSCWRWLENRTDTPWYESVRLFRQSERGNWAPVIAEMRRELQALADARSHQVTQSSDDLT
jgi:Tfp pilus assembly protein PilF